MMSCKITNTVTGENDCVNCVKRLGAVACVSSVFRLLLINISTQQSDREPALTETTQARFKQGNRDWWAKMSSQLQHLFSFLVVERYCTLITWRFTEGTLQQGPLRGRLVWNSQENVDSHSDPKGPPFLWLHLFSSSVLLFFDTHRLELDHINTDWGELGCLNACSSFPAFPLRLSGRHGLQ